MGKKTKSPAIFLDRDGTIIDEPGYLSDPKKIFFFKTAMPGLKLLYKNKFKLVIITNQSAIARGYVSVKGLSHIHQVFRRRLAKRGIFLSGIYYCPHMPDAGCACRKPKPKLGLQAARELNLDLKKSFMIGDQTRDMQLAANLKVKGVLVLTGFGIKSRKKINEEKVKVTRNLLTAAKWITAVFLFLLGSSFVQSAPIALTPVSNESFPTQEKLTFTIKYEFITAGTATMEIREGPVIDSKPTAYFISKAESTGFVDSMFKVRDYNESTVDLESMTSIKFHQNLHEGHYKIVRNTTIDYSKGTWVYERQYKGKTEYRNGEITQPASDILSSFFYARTLPLQLGCEYFVTVFSDGGTYPLRVVVEPKLQTINVPAGKFECILIQPFFVGDTIFKAKDNSMLIWMTNDKRKMPVLIRSKVLIGAFDAELTKIE